MDLQAKLEQAQRDNNIVIVRMAKEIEDIERQIADSEVTYSIGDRFKSPDGDKTILVSAANLQVVMAYLKSGSRDSDLRAVTCWHKIPEAEFNRILDFEEFTRYWDARKKCKC